MAGGATPSDTGITEEWTFSGIQQTIEDLYKFVESYCHVPAIGQGTYEDSRKDYVDTMAVWHKLQTRIEGLKGNLEILQAVMNAGNIKQEVFNQYYETQRDLTYCFGQEVALLLRRSASAVIFQAAILKN